MTTRELSPARDAGDKKRATSTVAPLELLRGLASLNVFVWHLINTKIPVVHIPGLYYAVAWSRESVIVFFVLSGYVICLSQERKHRDAGPFFLARIKRICPIYWVALIAALGAALLMGAPYTPWQYVGHLLFLQSYEGSVVMPLSTDGPLWSLGTEFEFYMVFTLVLFCRRPGLMLVWWFMAIAAMLVRHAGYFGTGVEALFLEFLSLSPCWLLGCFMAGLKNKSRHLSFYQALALFSMMPLVSWSDLYSAPIPREGYDGLRCYFLALLVMPLIDTLAKRQLHPESKPVRHGWPLVAVVYVVLSLYESTHSTNTVFMRYVILALPPVLCLFVYGLSLFKHRFNRDLLTRIALFMGASSYALYAIHTPFLRLVPYFISNHYLQLPILLLLVVTSVLLLEYVFQPWAARGIDRLHRAFMSLPLLRVKPAAGQAPLPRAKSRSTAEPKRTTDSLPR